MGLFDVSLLGLCELISVIQWARSGEMLLWMDARNTSKVGCGRGTWTVGNTDKCELNRGGLVSRTFTSHAHHSYASHRIMHPERKT